MTREEAVSIIEDRIRVTEYVESSYVDCVDIEALRIAIKALKQTERKWIPCYERLPDQQTEVIYSYEQYVSTGYMTDRDYKGDKMELHWEDMESGALIYPEAWMPLPEPWRGEKDD